MKGIGVSPGISIGRARVIKKREAVWTGILIDGEAAIQQEIEKYDHAIKASIEEIEAIKEDQATVLGDEELEILEAHIELLDDPQIQSDVEKKIQQERKNAGDAVIEVIRDIEQLFLNMDDAYMKDRAADVRDIGNRIGKHLNKSLPVADQTLSDDTIIIAEDITPSDTITMDVKHVIGFATQTGGKTSHAAIIAKSRGIPAVVGCGEDLRSIEDDDVIILDGSEGIIIANPDPDTLNEYRAKLQAFVKQSTVLKGLKDLPAVTADGVEIKLEANISKADDLEDMFENGGTGVGLLRTELLFMGRDSFPTEEEQFEFYKKVALKSRSTPVTIRTLDIGGDKQLSYFGLPAEQNPFLGYRAIRICLDRKDIFLTQLRAIFRASAFGNFRIMFPMISALQEIREAKAIVLQAKEELKRENIAFDETVKIGIMIEIPSAAILADVLAKEVDFFSIGTNDLCQYTLAVDRMNEKIEHLYDPFNPGVLRLIHRVIEEADKNGIEAGMCGEMASDPLATVLLVGMGLKEFSMSAASIPMIKNNIRSIRSSEAGKICKTVMEMADSTSIKTYLQRAVQ